MITINNKKFAANKAEFVQSLFATGGTAVGYYIVIKKSISLFDSQRNKVGCICNNVLAKATKLDNGRFWYSYGIVDIIGKFDSYLKEREEIEAIEKELIT